MASKGHSFLIKSNDGSLPSQEGAIVDRWGRNIKF